MPSQYIVRRRAMRAWHTGRRAASLDYRDCPANDIRPAGMRGAIAHHARRRAQWSIMNRRCTYLDGRMRDRACAARIPAGPANIRAA